jgi:hypothetical protein
MKTHHWIGPIVLLLCMSSQVEAQWLKYPTPGIPRTPDGAPNFAAPAPRTSDGKPDFSGVWGFDAGASLFYIPGDLKPDEIQPSAREAVRKRSQSLDFDDTPGCQPEGPRFNHFLALPNKIVQTPALMIVMSENLTYRQIFLDGRPLPDVATLSFMGYSVGHWDGDTLVVETIGYNEKTKLDISGFPHTENLRLTERYRRLDFGHMEIQETLSDPDIYARPLTVMVKATLVPDTELLEYVCSENDKDRKEHHLVQTVSEAMKAVKAVKVAPEILVQYVGTYDFRWPENPTVPSLWSVTMNNGDLFLEGAPLVPVSERQFVWAGAGVRIEFVKDAQGRVTHMVGTLVEGDLIIKKLPDRK